MLDILSPPIVTLAGLIIALIGSVLLYLNAGSLLENTKEGDITFTHPKHLARERTRARLGFSFVALGFLLQSIGVALPLVALPPKAQPNSATPAVATRQQPSATELFSLRSKCAALGEKIVEESPVGSALSQSQISRYDIDTGRCFVEVTVQTADTTVPMTVLHRYLYDGHTRELLATQSIDHDKKSGIVFKTGAIGFDQTGDYIDKVMKEK